MNITAYSIKKYSPVYEQHYLHFLNELYMNITIYTLLMVYGQHYFHYGQHSLS